MLYFNSLPKILTLDESGNPILLTNILTRAKLIESLQNNPMLFYTYNIQDGDTPEIIASKYYDDPNLFWLVTYSNQIMDPVWDWPLPYQQFLDYIDSKYSYEASLAGKTPFEYTNTTTYSYQQIIDTTDSITQVTTTNVTTVNYDTYLTIEPSTNTYSLPLKPQQTVADTCTVNINKKEITIFDYEFQTNEEKRNIKILNKNYANQMQQTFVDIMSK